MNETAKLDTQLVYVVDRNNKAAWSVVQKICRVRVKPGQFISVTTEEFEALKSGVLVLKLPNEL